MHLAAILFFSHSGERDLVAVRLTLKAKPKTMEIMINNVVLMFPPPMKRHLTSRERIVRSYCSIGSREIDSS